MWQFAEAVAGIGEACRALDIPITGGNVSLYNETDGAPILPTPVIGVVGVIEDASTVRARAFPADGLSIVLIGENHGELGGSEYLKTVHGLLRGGLQRSTLRAEAALQRLLVDLAGKRPARVRARLLRRRAGGHAGGVLLRLGRHRRGDRRAGSGV